MGQFQSKFEISTDNGATWTAAADPRTCFTVCQKLGLPTDWVGLPNRVDLARGRLPGRAFLLLQYSDIKALGFVDLTKQGSLVAHSGSDNSIQFKITCQLDTPGTPEPFNPISSETNPSVDSSLTPTTQRNALLFTGWYFVQAVALLSSDDPTSDTAPTSGYDQAIPNGSNIYLCEFADSRILGNLTSLNYRGSILISASNSETDANLDPADKPIFELCNSHNNGQAPLTATDIFNGLTAHLPAPLGFNALSSGSAFYPVDPLNIRYEGVSQWDAIIHFLSLSALTVAIKRDGTFITIPKGKPDTPSIRSQFDNNGIPRYSPSRTIQGTLVSIPEKVIVQFPRAGGPCGGPEGTDLTSASVSSAISGYETSSSGSFTDSGLQKIPCDCSFPFFSIEIPTSLFLKQPDNSPVPVVPGTTYSLVDYSLFAIFDFTAGFPIGSEGHTGLSNPSSDPNFGSGFSTNPVNIHDLNSRAYARAKSFLETIYQPTNLTDIFHGLFDILPSSNVEKVSFYDFGRGTHTQVIYASTIPQESFPKMNYYFPPREFRGGNG